MKGELDECSYTYLVNERELRMSNLKELEKHVNERCLMKVGRLWAEKHAKREEYHVFDDCSERFKDFPEHQPGRYIGKQIIYTLKK